MSEKLLAPLVKRIRLALGRGIIKRVNDSEGIQTAQITGFQNETRSNVERFQEYGLSSHPHPSAEAAIIFLGGNRDHGIILGVDDRRYRLKGLAQGEVALYTDEGDKIHLKRGNKIEVQTNTFTVNTQDYIINASSRATFNTPELRVSGDALDNYNTNSLNMSGFRSLYDSHTHDENDNGGPTDVPNQLTGGGGSGGSGGSGSGGSGSGSGEAATIAIGTVTTGAPGSSASVTNVGTSSAAIFDFSIPAGADGADGDPGAAATIAIGSVTTVADGTPATVTNTGDANAAVFAFQIPAGPAGTPGTPGTDGNDGNDATIAIGTVTGLAAGESPTVTNTGTAGAAVLDFGIPAGAQGAPGNDGNDGTAATVAVGTVTAVSNGSPATVTNSGNANAAVFDFEIPAGPAGAPGTNGNDGNDGNDGDSAYQIWLAAGNTGTEQDFLDSLVGSSGGGNSLINNSGRFYCYTNNRWVTDSDDNYGPAYYQFNENGGTGATPIAEWEHMGFFIPAGKNIDKLHFVCRSNSTEVTDIELYGILRHPDTAARWETGLDNDGEDTEILLFNELFMNMVGETAFGGNMADRHRRTYEINQAVNQDSYLSLYLKPIGTITATRYVTATYTWEVS